MMHYKHRLAARPRKRIHHFFATTKDARDPLHLHPPTHPFTHLSVAEGSSDSNGTEGFDKIRYQPTVPGVAE